MRTIGTLPPDLCRMIFRAGRRKVVLVEGKDDVETFEQWFPDLKSKLLFYDCTGYTKVEDWLSQILTDGHYLNVFGIRDRDLDYLPTESKVTQCYNKKSKNVRLYITRLRNLENYLVDAQLLYDFFKALHRDKFKCQDTTQLENELLKIGQQLINVTAANMVIAENNASVPADQEKPTEFATGALFNANKKDTITATASKTRKSKAEITRQINPKITNIKQSAISLSKLNEYVDGKRYLMAIKTKYGFVPTLNQFYNLLCSRIPAQNEVPEYIKYIIKEKILKFW